ncbi:hypothetical protein L1887_51909 [Cichorium endivia]|nr:hypothetical protein L1887_51909 [Cichorium endivia]
MMPEAAVGLRRKGTDRRESKQELMEVTRERGRGGVEHESVHRCPIPLHTPLTQNSESRRQKLAVAPASKSNTSSCTTTSAPTNIDTLEVWRTNSSRCRHDRRLCKCARHKGRAHRAGGGIGVRVALPAQAVRASPDPPASRHAPPVLSAPGAACCIHQLVRALSRAAALLQRRRQGGTHVWHVQVCQLPRGDHGDLYSGAVRRACCVLAAVSAGRSCSGVGSGEEGGEELGGVGEESSGALGAAVCGAVSVPPRHPIRVVDARRAARAER